MKTLELIISNIDFIEINGEPDIEISDICYDSRKCSDNSLFVAINGYNTDGHKYINEAIKNGSRAIICEKIPEKIEFDFELVFIKVNNSRIALSQISYAWYDHPNEELKLIGVTGTNGKTTVSYLIKSILESAGKTTGLIGTTGIQIGKKTIDATHTTPESLELARIFAEMKKNKVEYVIMEVSSHALHQDRTYGLNFKAGVFTNITHEHLDYHKTMDNYAKAKKILFDNLDKEAIALVNSDSKYSEFIIENCDAPKYKLSVNKNTDFNIENISTGIDSTTFDLIWHKNNEDTIINLDIKLPGKFNIENTSIAAATALLLDIDSDKVQEGILRSKGAPGRMNKIKLNNEAIGIIDYAHTPDALEKALTTLKDIIDDSEHKNNKLICVFGCGGDRDKAKRPRMGKIASDIADKVIITNDNPRTENPQKIIKDILEGITEPCNEKCFIIKDRKTAINEAYKISKANDIILIAGKGHETYQILGTKKIHFDDMEELKNVQKSETIT